MLGMNENSKNYTASFFTLQEAFMYANKLK